jgi:phosphatidylglycerol:prolipoprotein diacylglycerol transferase
MYSHFSQTDWVTPFGLIFILAILVAWYFARRNASSIAIDPSHVDLIVPVTIVVGIAGGTVLAAFMPMDHQVAGEAMDHGLRIRLFSMLGTGAIGLFIYSRIAGLEFSRMLDLFALPTLAGLAVHRVGCFLAGCCWGDIAIAAEVDTLAAQVQSTSFLQGIPGAVQYPPGSLPFDQHLALGLILEGAPASLPVYPVQLYEAVLLLVMIFTLSRVRWRSAPRGTLAVLTVFSYALMRFFIEYLRADGQLVFANLSITQLQCIMLALSILLLPRLRGRMALRGT